LCLYNIGSTWFLGFLTPIYSFLQTRFLEVVFISTKIVDYSSCPPFVFHAVKIRETAEYRPAPLYSQLYIYSIYYPVWGIVCVLVLKNPPSQLYILHDNSFLLGVSFPCLFAWHLQTIVTTRHIIISNTSSLGILSLLLPKFYLRYYGL